MAGWVRCTTASGDEIRVNIAYVVTIRPHNRDRGGTGSELTFVGGTPSSLVVKEDHEHLLASTTK
jgi:hypothetical protein